MELLSSRLVASGMLKPSVNVGADKKEGLLPDRKQFQSSLTLSPELEKLLEESRAHEVTEDELKEQRVSFAFGNAPESELITKESVRFSSNHIRLKSK